MLKKIVDRRTRKILGPSPAWIPEGTSNLLVDVVDKDGKVIGNLEIGTDKFIQGVWNVDGLHWRLEYSPSQDKAIIRAWALR